MESNVITDIETAKKIRAIESGEIPRSPEKMVQRALVNKNRGTNYTREYAQICAKWTPIEEITLKFAYYVTDIFKTDEAKQSFLADCLEQAITHWQFGQKNQNSSKKHYFYYLQGLFHLLPRILNWKAYVEVNGTQGVAARAWHPMDGPLSEWWQVQRKKPMTVPDNNSLIPYPYRFSVSDVRSKVLYYCLDSRDLVALGPLRKNIIEGIL